MIVARRLNQDRAICVRVRGTQSTAEFGELGRGLVQTYATAQRLLILLDWSALTAWDNKSAVSDSLRGWTAAAAMVERVAIVHAPCWNRQAAVLAAALRIHHVDVRSWATTDLQRALVWLRADQQTVLMPADGLIC